MKNIKMGWWLVLLVPAGLWFMADTLWVQPFRYFPFREVFIQFTGVVAMAVMAFIFVYFMTVVVFTLGLLASGLDFISALTATIACITNAGPGLGQIGPAHNYASLSDVQKWMCTMVMLLGRLEIFTVFILFTPAYWKK